MSEVVFTREDIAFAASIANQIKEYCKNEGKVDLVKLGLLISYINYILNFASTSVVLKRVISEKRQ